MQQDLYYLVMTYHFVKRIIFCMSHKFIDAANGGRENRGEKQRPYDHGRITPEQREEWEKEKEKCGCEE